MDYLYKVLALNKEVKAYVINSTDLTNEALNRHDLWPSCASILGKTMTIALMIGGTLKYDCACTVKIDGKGPIGIVCADADSYGNVRGFVQNGHVNFTRANKLDEVTTLGVDGFIDVIKDMKLDNLFTSSIELRTGDLAKDFTYYFAKSEQTPSAILLGSKFGVDNKCEVCGGVLIQLLPFASENTIDKLEKAINAIPDLSELLQTNSLEDIIKLLFEDDYEIVDKVPVKFYCGCSKERFSNGMLTLSKETLQEMIDENKDFDVTCQYCNSSYTYTKEDLINLLEIKNDIQKEEK